jgi:hypothetical protein
MKSPLTMKVSLRARYSVSLPGVPVPGAPMLTIGQRFAAPKRSNPVLMRPLPVKFLP